MGENKKISKKKVAIIVMTIVILIVAISFKLKYDLGSSINTIFFFIDVGLFLGFMGNRIYKDWKIKEEMYYLNQELKKISSTYITQEEYQKISNDFSEGKYSTLKEEWDSFAESIFFENNIAFQTVDAELFFNDSTLLKEKMNKRLLWLIVIIILLLSSFNVILQIKHSLSKKKSIREEIVAVNKKIEEIKADIEKYDKKIASLDDEFEKEKVARNMFQMVKENEVIYKYVEKNNNKTENTEEEK